MPSSFTTHESEQTLLNKSFNKDTGLLQVETMKTDGVGSRLEASSIVNTKITTSGLTTYVGISAPGTAQSTAKWQCKKIVDDGLGTVTITWADGNGSFDNISTDLTSLSYS